jgi:hypothetical protein
MPSLPAARPAISTKSFASRHAPACVLFLADYHLTVGNLAESERLISETGYDRRDGELEKLRKRLAGSATASESDGDVLRS